MTIPQALTELFESEIFKAHSWKEPKLRMLQMRFNKDGMIGYKAAIEVLERFGYRVTVTLNKAIS